MTATATRLIWTESDGWLLPEMPQAEPDRYYLCMAADAQLLQTAQELGYEEDSRCFSRSSESSCFFLKTFDDWLELDDAIAQLEAVGISRDRLMVNPGPYSVWTYKTDFDEIAQMAIEAEQSVAETNNKL